VFYLERARPSRPYRGKHLALLDLLAGQMGIALEREALYDRVRAEIAERRATEERLRMALDGTTDGSWDWASRPNEAHFSDRYYPMLGYAPGDFPGTYESWRALLHPDDAARAEKAVQQAVERRVPFAVEFRCRTKSGDWRWILGRGNVATVDGEGNPLRVAGSHTDISARKRAEEALERRILALTRPLDDVEDIAFEALFNLAELQELQNSFAEACGVAALLTRTDGTPITEPSNFTRFCLTFVRGTRHGLANCTMSDSVVGRFNEAGPTIQSCLSAGLCTAGTSIAVGGRHIANWLIGQVRNENQSPQKIAAYAREIGVDEAAFLAEYAKVPVMSQEQFTKLAHFLFVLANQISTIAYQNIQQARFIKDRMKAEEEVRRLNEELERRVRERTVELEEANKELTAFTFSVSHDLRAPLRAIHGYTSILREDHAAGLGEEGRRIGSIICSQVLQMERLIDDLLRLSGLSRRPIAAESLDMEGMVTAVFHDLVSAEEQRRIEFVVSPLPGAYGDPSLIRQVLMNLLSNAVKYTSKRDRARIRVGGERGDGETRFWVEDDGVGFDMQYADKLFGVFQRLHSPSEFPGSGVGLAIVQRIVRRHGGKVWATGELGRGAVFSFSLPDRRNDSAAS